MTPALLREAGLYLHGERWRLPLALDLGKNERTLRRYEAAESPVPADDWLRIRDLVIAKGRASKSLLDRMG